MKQIYISIILCLVSVLGTITLSAQSSSPFIDAMRLHGDISCMNIYHQYWYTEFGERVESGKGIETTLYYSKDHRLLYINTYDNLYCYYFDNEYDDAGKLVTIDCYQYDVNSHNYGLNHKIKLREENGVTIGYCYWETGSEAAKYSPYNAIPPVAGCIKPNIDPYYMYTLGSYMYLFAFDIVAAPVSSLDPYAKIDYNINAPRYNYEYNGKKQLTAVKINNSEPVATLSYDETGNVARIDIQNEHDSTRGDIYIFEYEYGNFEESEKHRMSNVLARLEREKAQQDSIARAERIAKELKEKEEEEKKERLSELRELLDTTVHHLDGFGLFKRRNITSISQTKNGLQIVLKNQTQSEYPIVECIEYSEDHFFTGKKYNYTVYYNKDFTRLIIRSDQSQSLYFVEYGDQSSQKTYSVPNDFRNIVEEYLSSYNPSYEIRSEHGPDGKMDTFRIEPIDGDAGML